MNFRDGQPVFQNDRSARGGYSKRRGEAPADGGAAKPAQGRGTRSNENRSADDKRYSGPRREDRFHKGPHAEDDKRFGGEKRFGGDKRTGRDDKTEYPFKSAQQQEQERGSRFSGTRGEAGGERRGRYPDKRGERYGESRSPVSRENPENAAVVNADELPYILMGRNAVKEALKSGRSIDRILVQGEPDGSLREILALARENNVQYREVERSKLDEMCLPFGHGNKTGNHQGIVAQVPGVQYCEIADILDAAKERNEKPFVIVLDGIEDPHNLGSILRSAECAGAHGVIIPKRRATGVTAAACKASAGAVEYIKVCQVANLSGALARLKDAGLWIAGADMSGEPMVKADLKGALALVIGSEGRGISELVKKNCDFLVSVPMKGSIGSLNASVAAAVLMYEKMRKDAL